MKPRTAALVVLLAALAGLALLVLCAPAYLTLRGFPLDDAWIHAVYGRSIARAAALAYNPGIPATGSTSPLWAVVFAVPHLLTGSAKGVVLLIKLIGFALHVAAAVVLIWALDDGATPVLDRCAGAALAAVHPDVLSAGVSGMEVPLAALAAALLLGAARRWPPWAYALLCALAPLARPELGLITYAIPFFLYARADRRRFWLLIGAATAGNAVCFGVMAARNAAISGLLLPATFYAKVNGPRMALAHAEVLGFGELLGHLAVADASILLAVLAAVALWRSAAGSAVPAAAALLSALAYCVVSFALLRSIDPTIFYSQRYVLPVIPLLVAAMPVLAGACLRRCLAPVPARLGYAALLALLAAGVAVAAPPRYRRLDNDAHNIDDVQVTIGKRLADATPGDVVWATDAGAIRYFGNAFVVDLIGLNNAQMLGPRAQAFLDAHPPRYLEVVGGWVQLDDASIQTLHAVHFRPSTPYTVTSFWPMANQWLVTCPPDHTERQLRFALGAFHFNCAAAGRDGGPRRPIAP